MPGAASKLDRESSASRVQTRDMEEQHRCHSPRSRSALPSPWSPAHRCVQAAGMICVGRLCVDECNVVEETAKTVHVTSWFTNRCCRSADLGQLAQRPPCQQSLQRSWRVRARRPSARLLCRMYSRWLQHRLALVAHATADAVALPYGTHWLIRTTAAEGVKTMTAGHRAMARLTCRLHLLQRHNARLRSPRRRHPSIARAAIVHHLEQGWHWWACNGIDTACCTRHTYDVQGATTVLTPMAMQCNCSAHHKLYRGALRKARQQHRQQVG